MRKGIFYSPGPDDSANKGEEKVEKAPLGLDALSDEEIFSRAKAIDDPEVQGKLDEILKDDKVIEERKEEKKEEKDKEEKEEKKEEKKEEEKKEEKKENTEDSEFEHEPPQDENDFKEEKESTWKDVASELGITTEGNEVSFEDFKKSFETKLEEARKEGAAKATEINLEKYNSDARKLIEFLEAGGTVDEFVEPLTAFKEILALDDESLVKKHYELSKWDSEKVEAEIESLKDSGSLEQKAYALRKNVENVMELEKQKIYDAKVDQAKQRKASISETQKKFDNSVKEILNKTEKFMGGKMNEKTLAPILKKLENGEYRRRLESDPTLYAKAILSLELGENVVKSLSKQRFEQGRESVQEVIHNTKKDEKKGAGRTEQSKAKETGDFSAWESIKDDKLTGIEIET